VVSERDDKRKRCAWSESDAGNLRSNRFNVNRKACAWQNVVGEELLAVVEAGFDPDASGWSDDFGKFPLSSGFSEIEDSNWSKVPGSDDSSWVICR
jgi:hypothetical protein